MKFSASSVFIAVSIFLDSIDLIISQPSRANHTKLVSLFPESSGVHFPPIEEIYVETAESIPNFTILNGHPMTEEYRDYLKRGDFIFGYREEIYIKPLSKLFRPRLDMKVYPIFDLKNHLWYTLSLSELQMLGVGRILRLVLEHDKAHAIVHSSCDQTNLEAHNEASKVAYLKTKAYEGTLGFSLFGKEREINAVKDHYLEEYLKAYQSYVRGASGKRLKVQ